MRLLRSASDIPWNGPVGGVTVGRIDGEWVVCPPLNSEESDVDLLLAARRDGIVMVEGGSTLLTEAEAIEGLRRGHEALTPVFDAIDNLVKKAGKEKRPFVPEPVDEEFAAKIRGLAKDKVAAAAYIPEKLARYAAMGQISKDIIAELGDEGAERSGEIKDVVGGLKSEIVRHNILTEGRRIDGRGLADIREIECEVGILPRTHGSSLFTRGETQGLVTLTLGSRKDEQKIDALSGAYSRRFLLHYNFPAFSVGEVRMLRGPGRREIGHGTLAMRGVTPVIPDAEDFHTPCVSCPRSLSRMVRPPWRPYGNLLHDAGGVPLKAPVAGIAMGQRGENVAVLSDILGDEDHLGDMDFKVVGTPDGITALQMDIKIESLGWDVLATALEQAREGRLHILGEMAKTIEAPSDDLGEYAPRIFTVLINPDKIRDLNGPGGKHIKGIVADTGVDIDVTDDGRVAIAAVDGESAAKAIDLIRSYTEEPEVGKTYLGTVAKTVDFGAFVTIMPGTDGLCHISELSEERVRNVEDILRVGDEVLVKVIGIDNRGKIKLSRRAALEEQGESTSSDSDDE